MIDGAVNGGLRRERRTADLALSILQRSLSVRVETLQIDAVRLSLRVLLPHARGEDLSEFWIAAGWRHSSQRRKRLGILFEAITMSVRSRPG